MTGSTTPGVVATAQTVGTRDHQEDTLAVQRFAADAGARASELLLVLADGMGGHAGSDIASWLVIDCFSAAYRRSSKAVPAALRRSLDAVLDASELRGWERH